MQLEGIGAMPIAGKTRLLRIRRKRSSYQHRIKCHRPTVARTSTLSARDLLSRWLGCCNSGMIDSPTSKQQCDRRSDAPPSTLLGSTWPLFHVASNTRIPYSAMCRRYILSSAAHTSEASGSGRYRANAIGEQSSCEFRWWIIVIFPILTSRPCLNEHQEQ